MSPATVTQLAARAVNPRVAPVHVRRALLEVCGELLALQTTHAELRERHAALERLYLTETTRLAVGVARARVRLSQMRRVQRALATEPSARRTA